MSKTFRNDYNLDEITVRVERVETCMDCGAELYQDEVQYGVCDACAAEADAEVEYSLADEYADGAVDEDDAEAMKWLAGSI